MKYFVCSLIFLLSFLLFPKLASAQSADFELHGVFIYEFTGSGTMRVREEVSIRNLKTEVYAPSFTFDVTGFSPSNFVAYESGLTSKLVQESDQKFEITLKNPVLGKGSQKKVAITFDDASLAQKKGEVWEVHIPKVHNADAFQSLTTVVRIQKEDAAKLHIFPPQTGVTKGPIVEYTFDTEISKNQAITAFLGDVAAYDFTLKYPLTNTTRFSKKLTFAIPPDTAFQKVYLGSISETATLSYDADGNWIATTSVPAMDKKTIEVSGTVFVFAKAVADFPKPNADAIAKNIRPMPYWESEDSHIKEIAKTHNTPRQIYDYVVETLLYDYTKTSRPQERLGASRALAQKENAICMEFTDLFIAIARAAGIPAREVNGFALSDDSLRPRELGSDILHSWPEYWDSARQLWIPVDPTWGKTTGGVDYFSHLDLSHIAFVIHGYSSTAPQTPGTYKAEEGEGDLIHIVTSKNPQIPEPKKPNVYIKKSTFGLLQLRYELVIENDSSQALYNVPVQWRFGNEDTKKETVVGLLPFSSHIIHMPLSTGFFGSALPKDIYVEVGGEPQSTEISKAGVQIMHLLLLITPFIFVPIAIIFFIKKHEKHNISR